MPLQTWSGATPISSNKRITKETCNCRITLSFALMRGRVTHQSYGSLCASRTEETAVSLGAAGWRRITHYIKEQDLELNCNQQGNGLEKAMRDTVLSWQFFLLDLQVSAVVGGSSPK